MLRVHDGSKKIDTHNFTQFIFTLPKVTGFLWTNVTIKKTKIGFGFNIICFGLKIDETEHGYIKSDILVQFAEGTTKTKDIRKCEIETTPAIFCFPHRRKEVAFCRDRHPYFLVILLASISDETEGKQCFKICLRRSVHKPSIKFHEIKITSAFDFIRQETVNTFLLGPRIQENCL